MLTKKDDFYKDLNLSGNLNDIEIDLDGDCEDLEDFLKQMKQIRKMGPLENLLKLIPGASKMGLNKIQIDPKQISRIEAIILSMTPNERKNPSIIKSSRKTRIAKGSGVSVSEVNKLLEQFENYKKMVKSMMNGNLKLPF